MANSKVTQLTAATAITDDDLLYVVNDPLVTPASRKITVANMAASSTQRGLVELATTTEAAGGVDTARAVTPEGVAAYLNQLVPLKIDSAFRFALDNETTAKFSIGLEDMIGNDVAYIGHNYGAGASTPRIVNTLPAIGIGFEYDYVTGGLHYMEYYLEMYEADGTALRPIMVNFQRDALDTNGYIWFKIGNNTPSQFVITKYDDTMLFNILPNGYVFINQCLYFNQAVGIIGINGGGEVRLADAFKIVGNVGFYNTAPQAKPTIAGSRGGNAALASLLTALATLGLITDSTT